MVEEVTTDELATRLDEEDVQILDVREYHELAQTDGEMIPGALHVPMTRLAAEIEDHDWSSEIYVICRHGHSSLQAARLLLAYEGVPADARVVSVAGGYLDWDGELDYDVKRAEPKAAA